MTTPTVLLMTMVLATASADAAPVRAQRRIAILGEAAWNGLAGVGPGVAWHVTPRLSLDAAMGASAVGQKVGARVRVNLFESKVTPFVGAGLMAAGGTGGKEVELVNEGNTVVIDLKPSAFAQFVAGIDLTGRGGFTMLAMIGWAELLGKDNVHIRSGIPTPAQQQAMDAAYRSGPVLGFAFGYTFGRSRPAPKSAPETDDERGPDREPPPPRAVDHATTGG